MNRRLQLGIDLGTTVLKAGLFDSGTGKLVASAARRLTERISADGGREQSPGGVLRTLAVVLREVRKQAGGGWREVTGIGLAAQGGSSILADRTTGQALTPMVLWNDGRTRSYDARIAAVSPPRYWRKIALRDIPPAGLGRLLWLRERYGDLFCGRNIHVGAGEFAFFSLTGQWRQDPGHAIQIGGYNAAKGELAQEPFDLAGVPLSFVAPLRQGHETAPLSAAAARRLNLSEGIPVAGPYIDQEAGFLSAMGAVRRPLHCSLGTAWVANFILPPALTGGSPFQLVLPNPSGAGRLVVQPLLTGNASWDWALQTLIHPKHKAAMERATRLLKERILPPEGLTVLPWLTQANPLDEHSHGGGAVSGVSPTTSKEDIVRAVACGMAYELRRVLESVCSRGVCDGLVLGGGASRGECFQRLIATLFSPLPVFRQIDDGMSTARGALFGLSRSTARAPVARCRTLDAESAQRVRSGYSRYVRFFDALYGNILAGRPFTIREQRR